MNLIMLSRNSTKANVLSLLKHGGAFSIARRLTRRRLRILCYHGCSDDPEIADSLFIRSITFERRLAFLRNRGFRVLTLADAVRFLETGGRGLPDNAVVITIDDGWLGTFKKMLPILNKFSMPSTLYCDTKNLLSGGPVPHVAARYLKRIFFGDAPMPIAFEPAYAMATDLTASVASRTEALREFVSIAGIALGGYAEEFSYMSPTELRSFRDAGHGIELHTHSHTLGDFSTQQIADEISANRAALAEILECDAASFRHFAYPSGINRESAAPALRANGVSSATTLEACAVRAQSNLYLLPRILDGEHMSDLEFEAELCGVGELLRASRTPFRGARS